MSTQTPIVELFGRVVTATEAVILPYLQTVDPEIQQLHYLYGNPIEIRNRLINMDKVQAYQMLKYPLVAFYMDFEETPAQQVGQRKTARGQVVIFNSSPRDAIAPDRYQVNIKPILYPIYEELLRQLTLTSWFANAFQPPHRKIDHPYWGERALNGDSTENKLTDIIDAVELRGLELQLHQTATCVRTSNKLF